MLRQNRSAGWKSPIRSAHLVSAGAALLALISVSTSAPWQATVGIAIVSIAAGGLVLASRERVTQSAGGFFERTAEQLPGMTYRYVRRADGEVFFAYVSRGCYDVFGVPAEEALADPETVLGLINWDDRLRMRQIMNQALEQLSSDWWIGRATTRDGTPKWITVTARAHVLPTGEFAWDGIVLDDTRRQSELVESRNFLDSVIENLPDMVFLKDAADLKFVFLNKAGEDLLGFGRDELIGKSDCDFFPPDEARDFIERDRTVLEGREVVSYMREPVSTKNLGTRLLHTKKIPVCDSQGKPLYLLGISEDVTDRIHTEQALMESRHQLNAILNHAATPVLLHDVDGRVILFNEQALQMCGKGLDQVLGRLPEEFMSAEAAASYRRAEMEVRRTGRAYEAEEVALQGGEPHTFITIRFPLFGNEGEVVAVGTMATDITEHKRIMVELEKAKVGAESANLAKSVFLSRMSHELRTPLNAILGFAQLLEFEELPEDQQETVQFILNAGRHLLRLINEVLDISRIESGNFSVSVEPVQVQEVLLEVASMVRPLADARQISVILGKIPESAFVRADRQRISQAMLNLLSNAVKYNREGGSVKVCWSETEAGNARLEVTDTGPGIPEMLTERLFVPFDRLGAEATKIEGTGLGLSLSRRLVEAMHGQMGLASTGPEGSTFFIELPSTPEPPDFPTFGDMDADGDMDRVCA